MKTLERVELEPEADWAPHSRASDAMGSWKTAVGAARAMGGMSSKRSATSGLETLFEELARRWERETAVESFPMRKAMHPAYQEIIAIGPAVIPLILKRLERRLGHWFWALSALAREDPAAGTTDLRSAREAWLAWGTRHGHRQ